MKFFTPGYFYKSSFLWPFDLLELFAKIFEAYNTPDLPWQRASLFKNAVEKSAAGINETNAWLK